MVFKWNLLLLGIVMLAACGGGNDSSDPSNSEDYQQLNLSENQEFTISSESNRLHLIKTSKDKSYVVDVINSEASYSTIFARLLDASLVPITDKAIIIDSNIYTFSYKSNTGEDVYLEISPSTTNRNFRYFVELNHSTEDGLIHNDATFEPNNALLSAYSILADTPYESTLSQYDFYDYYSLPVLNGQSIEIEVINNSDRLGNLWLSIMDDAGVNLKKMLMFGGEVVIR